MRIIKVNIFFLLALFSNITFNQGLFTVVTDKPEYSYGEKIIVEMTFLNDSDTTFSFWTDPYCITELSFVDKQLDLICSTADGDYHFPVGKSQTWYWIIDPKIQGIPIENGEQKVIGSFLHLLQDTVSFVAPRYYGGQLNITIKNGITNEAITSLKDSINATVIQDNGCNNYGCNQIWQIDGFSIDSLVTALESDYRINMLEAWRPIMLDTTVVTHVTDRMNLPDKFLLYQNYPNPFNPKTKINYDIPRGNYVKIQVFDILGKEMEILEEGYKDAGTYEIEFDGSKYPSGVYIYSISNAENILTRKMLLLK